MQVLATMAACFVIVLLATHMLFWRNRSLAGVRCALASHRAAKMDKSLLDSIQQLRYEEAVLEAERDKLLGTSFSQVRLPNTGAA